MTLAVRANRPLRRDHIPYRLLHHSIRALPPSVLQIILYVLYCISKVRPEGRPPIDRVRLVPVLAHEEVLVTDLAGVGAQVPGLPVLP